MTKNAKLTPAMQRVMEIVTRHGYVDLIRDGRTLRRTVDAMIERGLLREFGWWRRGVGFRYYPANTPEQVWDEAHAAQDVREQCGCLRNPLGHSRTEHPQPLTAKEMTDQMSTEGRQVVRDAAHVEAWDENEAWEARQADEQEADLNEQAEARDAAYGSALSTVDCPVCDVAADEPCRTDGTLSEQRPVPHMARLHVEALAEYREVTRTARHADSAAYQRQLARELGMKVEGDPRPGWVEAADYLNELSFYTPAAGDADRYNELGEPCGYVHRSAG